MFQNLSREEISNYLKDCEDCLSKAEQGEEITQEQAVKATVATGARHIAAMVMPYSDSLKTIATILKAAKGVK